MKKRFLLVLALLLALWTCASADEFLYVNGRDADRVHLRGGPSANAPSLGLYFTGTAARIDGASEGGWIPVTIGAESGYILADYLSGTGTVSRQPAAYVNTDKVNMRTRPSLTGSVLLQLSKGTALTVCGETTDGWYGVLLNGRQGYVMAQYVTLSESEKPAAGVMRVTLDKGDSFRANVLVTGCRALVYPTDEAVASCEYDPSLVKLESNVARGEHVISLTGDGESEARVYLPRDAYTMGVLLYVNEGSAVLAGGFNRPLGVYGERAVMDVMFAGSFASTCDIRLIDSAGSLSFSEELKDYDLNVLNIEESKVFIDAAGWPEYLEGSKSYRSFSGSGAVKITVDPMRHSSLDCRWMTEKFVGGD